MSCLSLMIVQAEAYEACPSGREGGEGGIWGLQ